MKKMEKMCDEMKAKLSLSKTINLVGKRFSKLLVTGKSEKRGNIGQIRWDCICDCGKIHTVSGESLRKGCSKSCGCNRLTPPNKNKDRANALMKYVYNYSVIKINKQLGIKTNIDLELFSELSLSNCNYCGAKPSNRCRDLRQGRLISNVVLMYNGLDRVVPKLGYVKENVVPCCRTCNRCKSDKTLRKFKQYIRQLYTHMFKVKNDAKRM